MAQLEDSFLHRFIQNYVLLNSYYASTIGMSIIPWIYVHIQISNRYEEVLIFPIILTKQAHEKGTYPLKKA